MSGFQVANFTFGKNIVDANIERARMALQNEQSIRSASLQERAQNISRDENRARLEESALQREENARQFDENNKLRNKQFEASRLDAERANYWDDAIKNQQIEINNQKFLTQNEELKRIMMIRQQEEDQMAHRQELIESSYGNAVIACELGGGFMSQGQVDDFNKSNGTDYNYVGKIDMSTGKQFSDGKIHFVKYDLDNSGHVIFDKATGRPMVSIDNPISKEFYTGVMGTYLGDMKNIYSRNGSGLTFDERMALQEAKDSAMKERLDSSNDARKRLRYAGDLSKRISDLQKEKAALEKDTVSKVSDPVGHNEKLFSLEDKISTLESERDGMFNDYSAESTETTDVPRVYKGRLYIPGIDGLFAPNEVFEAGGKKWTWDGKSDGNLQSHIKEVQ